MNENDQVSFNRSLYKNQALSESVETGHTGCIYFTSDGYIVHNGHIFGAGVEQISNVAVDSLGTQYTPTTNGLLQFLDYTGLQRLWSKITTAISSASNTLSSRIGAAESDITRLEGRVTAFESLSNISVNGGSVGIGSLNDLQNRTTAGDAKIPTVEAVADFTPKLQQLTQTQYDALTSEQKNNGTWYFIYEEDE